MEVVPLEVGADTRRQRTADRQRSTAAREPLLLATSLQDPAPIVVHMYSLRMQIEETFRDLKSHRYGWSLEDVRCRSAQRVGHREIDLRKTHAPDAFGWGAGGPG